jgi:D-beta-D-heptose 7-phosphate kinase/D-beta-D-heptose 1-phosphate adenosyltransferase
MWDKKKILLLGDIMLDVYTMGEVVRISPEAPVPILRVLGEEQRPGGAGNAILNLVSLGMDVVAMGRIGRDAAGEAILQALRVEQVDVSGLLYDSSFRTPLKNRMIAAGQQIVRIDYEEITPLSSFLEREAITLLSSLLNHVHLVAISDYGKGFLSPLLLQQLISQAKRAGIPVIVDPKGRDFSRYSGVTLIKPNLAEATAAAGVGIEASLEEIAHRILGSVEVDQLMITRAREGISLFSPTLQRTDFPAHVHEIKDVTGAGDTVLAVIAAAFANGWTMGEAAYLANTAAGMVIEKLGCARVTSAELAARLSLFPRVVPLAQ